MALILEITQQDGLVVRQPIDSTSAKIAAQPGDKLRVLDAATGQPASDLVARRVGDSLVVEQAGGATVELTEFFAQCAPGEGCELVLEDGDKTTTISQATEPMSVAADGSPVMYDGALAAQAASAPAQSGAAAAAGTAGAAEGAAAGGAAATTTSTGAIVAGVGAIGLAAAAGGGGGGGGEPQPPADTTAPEAPVINAVTGDNVIDAAEASAGVAVSGTAEAGSTVTVVWTNGAESFEQVTTASADGAWTVTFPMDEVPEDGATTITATATDVAGNASVASSVAVAVAASVPTIDAVTGDNAINAAEAAADVTLSGTAPAGSELTVAWGAFSAAVTAAADGSWATVVPAAQVPTADAAATVTSTNGSASQAVVIDVVAPGAPVVTEAGTGGVINGAAVAAGVSVTGTAEAGSIVDVAWGALTAQAVAAADGSWTASFAPGASDAATEITAVATDAAGNASAPSAPSVVTIDITAPAAPTIDPISGDGIVDATEAAAGVEINGTGEEGSVVTTNWGGIEKTATVTGGVWSVTYDLADVPAAGVSTVTATAASATGNPQTDPAASQSVIVGSGTTVDGTAGVDNLVGGAGDQVILGGDGADVLVGDSAGSIRNYQFDYWNITNPSDHNDSAPGTGVASSYIGYNPGATFGGWTALAGPIANPNDAGATVSGGHAEIRGTEGVDATGRGGTHFWDTVFVGPAGGAALSQAVDTVLGETYTLSIELGTTPHNTSFAIHWNGVPVAYYDGSLNAAMNEPGNWTGSAAATMVVNDTVPGDAGGNHTILSFTVDGMGPATGLELIAYGDPLDPDGGAGVQVHRVTLDADVAAGNDTLVGGAGNDLIFGQGGNDVLVGGDGNDTFVYSMRADNGNDVITDFTVGTDRIMLVDALDVNTAGSLSPYAMDEATRGTQSDVNLDANDFLVAGTQEIALGDDGSGNLMLTFTGEGGASLGSVTLQGVDAASYATVQSLATGGIIDVTGDGFHAGLNFVI